MPDDEFITKNNLNPLRIIVTTVNALNNTTITKKWEKEMMWKRLSTKSNRKRNPMRMNWITDMNIKQIMTKGYV